MFVASGTFNGICGNVVTSCGGGGGGGIDVLVFVVVQPKADSFCIDVVVFAVVQPRTGRFVVLKRLKRHCSSANLDTASA